MAKPIELETVLRGEDALRFNEYLDSPTQHFTPESRLLIQKAKRLSSKEWPL
ncbi:MAG: hypothetical protein Q7V05_01515 [Methanoregula sp.]|jgi:hypothetical protein|nr:hypothetical protein [Methanoregula sp.]